MTTLTTTTTTDLAELSGSYTIDPDHSRMGFVARHATVTKVRGSFDRFEGSAVIDGADLTRSSVTLTIEASSIDTRNDQRDSHLRSNDFLAMAEFPQIRFRSTSVRRTNPDTVEITGDLTIRGVTRSITVSFTFEGAAVDPFGQQRIGFEGSATINRHDFGVSWNAPLAAGGVLVSDRILLELEISAMKNS